MDSITQLVLGAACGEVVLGHKIGNKALLIGAAAGTIPDLDVFIGPFLYGNEIESMAFHRGFMHSIIFALIGALLFGYIFYVLYNKGERRQPTSMREWILLFFMALFTHSILDCFTPYGTQLFAPFSNYRVTFNTISVADPFYTLPFLVCLIVMMKHNKNSSKRTWWLKAAIGISSVYLILTVINKLYINTIFTRSLNESNIAFNRFRVQPTILNNILWYGIAETDDAYYSGFYSLLDSEKRVKKWERISKGHGLISVESENIGILAWVSDGYYSLARTKSDDQLIYNDLRYPSLDINDPSRSIFSFRIYKDGLGYTAESLNDKVPTKDEIEAFINRIKGI